MPRSNEFERPEGPPNPGIPKEPTIEIDIIPSDILYSGMPLHRNSVVFAKLRIAAAIQKYRKRYDKENK